MIKWLLEIIDENPLNTLEFFLIIFTVFLVAAYIGKIFSRKKSLSDKVADEEAKLILGAILSLLGLFIAFTLNVAIEGYNLRQFSEEKETIGIAKAYQYSDLLSKEESEKAKEKIKEYLDIRIEFFNSGYRKKHIMWQELSFAKQKELWDIGVNNLKRKEMLEASVATAVLSSYSELYDNQQKTVIGWQEQIPAAAWILLFLFSVSSNLLIGYNIRGIQGKNWMIYILPFLMAVSLFIIAEIDVPGEGVIHVSSKNLDALKSRILDLK